MRRVKQILCLCCMIFSAVCFSGCRKIEALKLKEAKTDDRFIHLLSEMCIDGGTAFYMSHMSTGGANLTLQYYDFGTGTSAPLCGKAECQHDSAECNANLLGYATRNFGLCCGKDDLYWISCSPERGIELTRAKKDGTDRSRAAVLSRRFPDPGFPQSDIQTIYHKGCIYVKGTNSEIVDGEWVIWNIVLKCDPFGTGSFETIYREKYTGLGGSLLMHISGDRLYYIVSSGHENREEQTLRIAAVDTGTGEKELVYDDTAPFAVVYDFWIEDEGKLLFTNAQDGKVYRFSEDDSSFDLLMDFSTEGIAYSCLTFSDNQVIGYTYPEDNREERVIAVRDFSGEILLEDRRMTPEIEKGGRLFLGSDGENLYYSISDVTGRTENVILVPVSDGEPKLMGNYIWGS